MRLCVSLCQENVRKRHNKFKAKEAPLNLKLKGEDRRKTWNFMQRNLSLEHHSTLEEGAFYMEKAAAVIRYIIKQRHPRLFQI